MLLPRKREGEKESESYPVVGDKLQEACITVINKHTISCSPSIQLCMLRGAAVTKGRSECKKNTEHLRSAIWQCLHYSLIDDYVMPSMMIR